MELCNTSCVYLEIVGFKYAMNRVKNIFKHYAKG